MSPSHDGKKSGGYPIAMQWLSIGLTMQVLTNFSHDFGCLLKVMVTLYKMIMLKLLPERIYKPITAMGFSAMFTFQLDNTKR